MGLAGESNALNLAPSQGREILFLIDGFGEFIFDEFASAIPAISESRKASPLSAHFPSTTVTNLTSIGTGRYPSEHGMVGYTMRIPWAQAGTAQLLNGLKWDERIDPLTWQSVPTLFERASAAGYSVNHIASARYEGSGFTRAALRGPRYLPASSDEEIIAALQRATANAPSFTYLYLNDVDDAGHATGVGSDKWLAALSRIDLLVATMRKVLPQGIRLWITADHGMVNAGQKVVLGDGNRLMEEVAVLGGEPRARHLYLGEHSLGNTGDTGVTGVGEVGKAVERVRQRWQEYFGDRVELLTPETAFGQGLSERVRSRIGDLIAVPRDATVLIEPERAEPQSRMVGHHGALTEVELRIPARFIEI